MERNKSIDLLKGIGILLMILGHCSIPWFLQKMIFTFHMPLFFLVSGYLYRRKSSNELLQSTKRIIKAYFLTVIIISPQLFYLYKTDWILSLFFVKNNPPILGYDWNGNIGSLWYLICFVVSLWIFNTVEKKINRLKQLFLFIFFFEVACVIKYTTGSVLPFQLMQASGGCLFLWIGYNLKECFEPTNIHHKKIAMFLSIVICLLLSIFGRLSMASFIYGLNILQIVGGFAGTYIIYQLCKTMQSSIIMFIGRYSLPILCIHSIDYSLKITELLTANTTRAFPIEFIFRIVIVTILFVLFSKVPIINKIYGI